VTTCRVAGPRAAWTAGTSCRISDTKEFPGHRVWRSSQRFSRLHTLRRRVWRKFQPARMDSRRRGWETAGRRMDGEARISVFGPWQLHRRRIWSSQRV